MIILNLLTLSQIKLQKSRGISLSKILNKFKLKIYLNSLYKILKRLIIILIIFIITSYCFV